MKAAMRFLHKTGRAPTEAEAALLEQQAIASAKASARAFPKIRYGVRVGQSRRHR